MCDPKLTLKVGCFIMRGKSWTLYNKKLVVYVVPNWDNYFFSFFF